MKAYCVSCGQPIELLRRSWWHVETPLFQRHYASPRNAPKRPAPETETEKRAAYGDR